MKELIKQLNEQAIATEEELGRIADHHSKKKGTHTDQQISDAIADDLEQLEYTPKQIAKYIPIILGKIKTD